MRSKSEIRAACDAAAKEQAKVVGAAAWYDVADKVLTADERAEVRKLWDSMAGNTCWVDALFQWMSKPADSAMLTNCLRDAAKQPKSWDVAGLLNDAADRIDALEGGD